MVAEIIVGHMNPMESTAASSAQSHKSLHGFTLKKLDKINIKKEEKLEFVISYSENTCKIDTLRHAPVRSCMISSYVI